MPTVDGKSPKLIPIDMVQLEKLAGLQVSQRNMAGFLGVSMSALENRLSKDPECRKAYERGRAKVAVAVVQTQVERALGLWKRDKDGKIEQDDEGRPICLVEVDQRALDKCATHLSGWTDKVDIRTGGIVDNIDPIQEMLDKMAEIDANREEGEDDG